MTEQKKPTGAETSAQIAAQRDVAGNLGELKLGIGAKRVRDEPKQGFGVHRMVDEAKRKSGGGKLSRSETVTVRLDPKLRYLTELAARKQRRTVSSYIEWAIEESLNRVLIDEDKTFGGQNDKSIADEAANLWDVDDPDRFAKLAIRYPDMLTHEEQTLWKLVRENGLLWKGRYDKVSGEWTWRIEESSLIFERLREHWETFNAVAKGEAEKSSLPTWVKNKDAPFEDFDADMPF